MCTWFRLIFLLLWVPVRAQELAQVTFSGGSQLAYFSVVTDGNLLIRISEDGRILSWGIEESSMRNSNYYAPQLQPYPGRVDHYGPEADSLSRGKVKTIGSAWITYYEVFEVAEKRGKVRSVGRMQFDYFHQFDPKELRGRIKLLGNLPLEYYSPFDDAAFRGKLKGVGNTPITYYSSFDDRLIRGKVRTIGPAQYTWYASTDRIGAGGGLKTGSFRQNVANITYILQ